MKLKVSVQDEVSLAFLENQAIDLTIPLKGGKVHGSLARAGKVTFLECKNQSLMSHFGIV